MIKINLIEKKKNAKPVVVLGVDVRTINFKLLFVAILIYYIPKNYMTGVWQEEIRALDKQIEILDAQSKTVREDLKSFDGVKQELESYKRQIEKLRERSAQVDRILKEKTSPKRLLERMARVAPQDLWFDELTIQDDRSLLLKGGADSYKSIGDLIVTLNETPYFKNSLNLAKSETKTEVDGGREVRTESYEIVGTVESFEIMGR
tara:strand:+ start:33203 stop:33817 length:615 start_codon:yes stop_codon:yes gene_type:complete